MANPYPQLVLLGDSLLQLSVILQDGFSFEAALQTHCSRRLDVVNRGLSGWNTDNYVKYLDQIFPKPSESSPKLEYLLILLGANDAVLPLPTTSQHVPIDRYKENLTKLINHPHIQAHKPKILLLTPPPVDEIKLSRLDLAAGHAEPTRRSAVTASYAEKAREVARENPSVQLIDLWQAIMDKAISMTPADYQTGGPWLGTPENGKQGGLDALLPDGLHMSGPAYRVLFDTVLPYIGQEWAQLPEGDRSGYVFPDWKELNPMPQP